MSKVSQKEMITSDEARIMLLEQKNDSFHETLMRIEKRLDHIDDRFDKQNKELDARFNKIDARFEKLDNELDARFDKVDTRLNNIDSELKEIRMHFDARIESNFKWILSLVLAFGVGLLGVMSHGFHWL